MVGSVLVLLSTVAYCRLDDLTNLNELYFMSNVCGAVILVDYVPIDEILQSLKDFNSFNVYVCSDHGCVLKRQ